MVIPSRDPRHIESVPVAPADAGKGATSSLPTTPGSGPGDFPGQVMLEDWKTGRHWLVAPKTADAVAVEKGLKEWLVTK